MAVSRSPRTSNAAPRHSTTSRGRQQSSTVWGVRSGWREEQKPVEGKNAALAGRRKSPARFWWFAGLQAAVCEGVELGAALRRWGRLDARHEFEVPGSLL